MVLQTFKDYLNRQKKASLTSKTYISNLMIAENFLGKPLDKTTTKEDIEKYLNSISKLSTDTIILRLIILKIYFKWLYGMRRGYPDVVDFPLPKKNGNGLISSDLLTEEDIIKMISVCDNLRDKALISLLFDSACRISELTNLNIEDVIIETDRTGSITVDGKTGKRTVPLSFSIPALRNWINEHPLKDEPNSPLFIALENRFGNRVVEQTVRYKLIANAKKINLNKRIFCHLFRHSRLTQLDKKGLSHTAMKYFAGWSKNSNMPSVYSHFSAQDTKELIYEADGIAQPKVKRRTILEPVICCKCQTPNDRTNKYCYLCGMGLDQEAQKVFEIQELVKELIKTYPELSKDISNKIVELKSKKNS